MINKEKVLNNSSPNIIKYVWYNRFNRLLILPVIIQAPLWVVLAALMRPLLKISLWWGSSLKFFRPPCTDITMSGFCNFHCRTISSNVNSGLVLSARRMYYNLEKKTCTSCQVINSVGINSKQNNDSSIFQDQFNQVWNYL